MCPLALPRLASPCLDLPCLEFHSRSRCTTMCSQWESDERARTCVCNTHTQALTYTLSLTHTHTLYSCLPWDFVSLSVPVPVVCSFPFFPCPLPSLSHSAVLYLPWEYLPALFSAFVFRGILLLGFALVVFSASPHLVIPPSFSLSHIHTPVWFSLFSCCVFAKCCQMFAVFPVVYFEALQNVAGFL